VLFGARYRAVFACEVLMGVRHSMCNRLASMRTQLRATELAPVLLAPLELEIAEAEAELRRTEVTGPSARGQRTFSECLAGVCGAVGAKAVRLQMVHGQGTASAQVPADLDVVLLALVENGLEASTAPVTVAAELSGLDLKIRITDHGDGIAPVNRNAVFRRGMTTKPGHLGYGLPVACHVAETIGAAVLLQSTEGEGVSALVHVRVP
jgi:signal transduction histidine kinase